MSKYSISQNLMKSDEGKIFLVYGVKSKNIIIPDIFFERNRAKKFVQLLNICNINSNKVLELAQIIVDN